MFKTGVCSMLEVAWGLFNQHFLSVHYVYSFLQSLEFSAIKIVNNMVSILLGINVVYRSTDVRYRYTLYDVVGSIIVVVARLCRCDAGFSCCHTFGIPFAFDE